jgi:hypothetical protein
MKINRENYELYFIDYLDGNLPVEDVDDVLDFLQDNPDLANELKGLNDFGSITEPVEVRNWEHLKKLDEAEIPVFDRDCIRFVENEMDPVEKSNFVAAVAVSSEKERTLKLYKATLLKADESVVFENKNGLKRRIVPIYRYWIAAAAVWILAMVFWFAIPKTKPYSEALPMQTAIDLSVHQPPVPKPEIVLQKPDFKKISKKAIVAEEIYAEKQLDQTPVEERIIDVPSPLAARTPELLPVNGDFAQLAVGQSVSRMHTKDYSLYRTFPQLLADGVDSFDPRKSFNRFTNNVLNTVRRMSNDKFDYENDASGNVTKIEYNSRILAFSVPFGDDY